MAIDTFSQNNDLTIITICCAFDNFSYLLICNKTGEAAVVDPTEAYPVLMAVEKAGARLTSVLCTHHHNDHIGGLEELLAEQPELEVYGCDNERDRIPRLTRPQAHGDSLLVGKLHGEVLHTPGHTRGSVCYLFSGSLFTGDTLFGAGCGRLFEGTAEQMYVSLNRVIGSLPENTQLYFGHEYTERNLGFAAQVEPDNTDVSRRLEVLRSARALGKHSTPSTLALEKATNPFLRCDSASIREHLPGANAELSEVEIFSRLRTLRNHA